MSAKPKRARAGETRALFFTPPVRGTRIISRVNRWGRNDVSRRAHMKNSPGIARHPRAMTLALAGLMTSLTFTPVGLVSAQAITPSWTPRPDQRPTRDSGRCDSQAAPENLSEMTATVSLRIAPISISAFKNVSLIAHPLVAGQVAKGHKSASHGNEERRQSLGTEIPLPFARRPFIRSQTSIWPSHLQ